MKYRFKIKPKVPKATKAPKKVAPPVEAAARQQLPPRKQLPIYSKSLIATDSQIVQAIYDSKGYISKAARAVGMSISTFKKRIEASPELQETLEAVDEMWIDVSEAKLHQFIKLGEWDAVKFHLQTKGARRGYAQRTVTSGSDGRPVVVNVVDYSVVAEDPKVQGKCLPAPQDP